LKREETRAVMDSNGTEAKGDVDSSTFRMQPTNGFAKKEMSSRSSTDLSPNELPETKGCGVRLRLVEWDDLASSS